MAVDDLVEEITKKLGEETRLSDWLNAYSRSSVGQRYPSRDSWEARKFHIPQGHQSAKGHPIGSHVDQSSYRDIAETSGVTAGLDKGRFIKTSHTG